MCGIVGVLCADDSSAVGPLYEALLALQHRGQDAAGIITEDAGRFCLHKDNGMVRDVFGPAQLTNLRGSIGIGHVRYPTAGSSSCAEAQPFYVNSPYGITLAHNGNLVDLPTLKRDLEREFRHLNTGSDSEVLLNLLAIELFSNLSSPSHEGTRSVSPSSGAGAAPAPDCVDAAGRKLESLSAFDGKGPTDAQVILAVNELLRRCSGGYACVSMIIGYGLLAFRDPHGIRPLSYGRRLAEGSTEHEYMVASESGALNALGFELLGDVPPGHLLLLRRGKEPRMHNCFASAAAPLAHAPCVFEYVYFARPDSVIDGISVYRTRLRMGEKLAHLINRTWAREHLQTLALPALALRTWPRCRGGARRRSPSRCRLRTTSTSSSPSPTPPGRPRWSARTRSTSRTARAS